MTLLAPTQAETDLPRSTGDDLATEFAAFHVPSFLRRTVIGGVRYKLACCREDWEAAFRVVHDAYVQRGLMRQRESGMEISPYHLLPVTEVFLAQRQGQVFSTTSLVVDDMNGLPMDVTFQQEIESLREQGLLLAEVVSHASRQEYCQDFRRFEVFVNLMALMAQSARENDVDRLVIVVPPRHVRFYRRFLGFELLGAQRPHATWRNSPAVALQHDFAALDATGYPLYDQIYAHRFHGWELLWQTMRQEEVEFFSSHVDRQGCNPPVAIG
jgi:hypothetical protein